MQSIGNGEQPRSRTTPSPLTCSPAHNPRAYVAIFRVSRPPDRAFSSPFGYRRPVPRSFVSKKKIHSHGPYALERGPRGLRALGGFGSAGARKRPTSGGGGEEPSDERGPPYTFVEALAENSYKTDAMIRLGRGNERDPGRAQGRAGKM